MSLDIVSPIRRLRALEGYSSMSLIPLASGNANPAVNRPLCIKPRMAGYLER